MSRVTSRRVISGVSLAIVCLMIAADSPPVADSQRVVAELQDWRHLIGEWRGIGQPRRGSQRGAWQEQGQVQWNLKQAPYGIQWNVEEGRLWKSLLFTTGTATAPLELRVQAEDDSLRTYRGKQDGERWVLESIPAENEPDADVFRLTITRLSEDRLVLLAEKRSAQQSFFQRTAEVAYQRQGTRLAARDASGPECVVTGGVGTIAVTHAGRTYYVCCTGCKEAFEQDPVAILKEWTARKQKAAAKGSSK